MNDSWWDAYVLTMMEGRFFEAHEILEIPWRTSHNHRLQIAIWLSAAFVHWSKGEYPGTVKLLRRILHHTQGEHMPIRERVAAWLAQAQSGQSMDLLTLADLEALSRWGREDQAPP